MHRSTAWLAALQVALLVAGCSAEETPRDSVAAAAGPRASDETPGAHLSFVDVAAEAGIDVVNNATDPRRWFIPESNGCGAAWLDHDGDGDLDLFVANTGRLVYHETDERIELELVTDGTCRLYRNDGGLRFTDVTAASGAGVTEWVNGVATGDVDGDGDTDLYLASFTRDVLLVNQGGHFLDGTAAAGLGNEAWGASATFGDVDRDGDLDLYVANYVDFDLAAPPNDGLPMEYEGVLLGWGPTGESGPGINEGAHDRFWRNDGDGTFTEATETAGFELAKPLCSYAAVFADVTGDRWPDLLVANDLEPCNLFVNRGDGTFAEEGAARGFAFDGQGKATAAMGLFVADVDGDGDQDVLRTNFDFETNTLHLNDGGGNFVDATGPHGLAEASLTKLGWGGGFFDADLDGDLDLLVANGHVLPQAAEVGMSGWAMRSQLFECVPGEEGRPVWRDVTDAAGPGLAPETSARGVALGDPDGDGDVDALIVDLDAPPRLLRNDSERRGRWLAVALEGTDSNRDGYGALVTVVAGGRRWTREMRTADGLFSAHDPRLHFGLGAVEAVDHVTVHWPSGLEQRVDAPALDAVLLVQETSERLPR